MVIVIVDAKLINNGANYFVTENIAIKIFSLSHFVGIFLSGSIIFCHSDF